MSEKFIVELKGKSGVGICDPKDVIKFLEILFGQIDRMNDDDEIIIKKDNVYI